MSTIPRWKDEDAVTSFVKKALDDADLEEERLFYTLRWDTHPGIPMDELANGGLPSRGQLENLAGLWRGVAGVLTRLLR
jgi:hypothetical protein